MYALESTTNLTGRVMYLFIYYKFIMGLNVYKKLLTCTFLTYACLLPRNNDASVPSACFNLFRLQVRTRHAYSESAQSDTPRDRYNMIIIKSTLLRKPLHYLIWWGNMDMHWSWWRVISINLNSPSLLYVLLLNLPFHIWMYSAKKFWSLKQNVAKESDLFWAHASVCMFFY